MKERVNARLVRLQAVHQMHPEAIHAIRQDAHAVQQVANHDWLEDIQLELAVHATDSRSDVVTHNLSADHSQGLALGGVNLARHDRRAGLVLGQIQLAETAARAGAEVAHVLGDLEQRAGEGVERSRGFDDGVVRGEHLELVGSGLELRAGHLADLGRDGLVESLEGVQTRADGRAALGELAQVRQGGLDALDVAV